MFTQIESISHYDFKYINKNKIKVKKKTFKNKSVRKKVMLPTSVALQKGRYQREVKRLRRRILNWCIAALFP